MNFGAAQNFLTPAAEIIAPLGKVDAAVRRGDSVRIEVVVRTRKVGHFFPGGTVDAFDVWVELEAVDEHGRTLLHSGAVADGGRGPVDPGAHFYRSLLLDEHGNPINKRNAWMARSVAYVRLIPPGAADTDPLPPAAFPRTAGDTDHPEGQGELPQVRLVEHAVGVRGRPRSERQEPVGGPRPRRRQVGLHRRHLRRVRAGEGHSRYSDHYHGAE